MRTTHELCTVEDLKFLFRVFWNNQKRVERQRGAVDIAQPVEITSQETRQMNILIYTFPIGSESREERLPPEIAKDKEAFAIEPHSDGTCTLWEWEPELDKWHIDWFSFSSVARATEWLRKYTKNDNATWVHL